MPQTKTEDPNPTTFRLDIFISALIIIVIGILVFIFASVVVGVILTLLGTIFGLGSQVVKNLPVE